MMLELAEDTIHVVASPRSRPPGDQKVKWLTCGVGVRTNLESDPWIGYTTRTYDVIRLLPQEILMVEDVLVPVSFEPDTSLLMQHARIVLGRVESQTGKITAHRS